jgi:integrase
MRGPSPCVSHSSTSCSRIPRQATRSSVTPPQAVQGRGEARRRAGGPIPRLRHTFGTRMAAQGVPLRTLQEWMGHRDLTTTQIYADYQADDRREADLVERAFASRRPYVAIPDNE